MPISDVAQISITTETAGITQAGFGTPLILSHTPTWVERTRTYTTLAGMVSDGFTSATPEYKAAAAMFAQNPRPVSVKVGRAALKPTQRYAITPNVLNSTSYRLVFTDKDGVETVCEYTSDANATAAEIIAGLKADIDAIGAAVTTSDQTTYLRVLANNPNEFFSIEVSDPALLSSKQDHADPGVGTDLDAIVVADNDWYGLVTLYNSDALITAAALWTESHGKLYAAASCAGDILGSGSSDVFSTLETAAYARTFGIYHPSPKAFADAALLGKNLPFDPGSETWAFKTLATVPAVTFTATQQTNLQNKHGIPYLTIAGRNVTLKGWTFADEFIDIVRGRDWLEARLGERIALLKFNNKKIPYTDAGIAMVEAEIRAQLNEAISVGFLAADPAPVVQVPTAASAAPADRAARILRDVSFDAQVAGAIHLTVISGVISA